MSIRSAKSHALAIVTYVSGGASADVRRRLPAAIHSLENSQYAGSVYVVDDGSTDNEHLRYLKTLDRSYSVIRRSQNGGISRAKNTCLRVLMNHGVDVGFIAEDDIEFRRGWSDAYLNAHTKTHIQHFSWAWDFDPSGQMCKVTCDANGFQVVATSRLNGVFLTFTPDIVRYVGGFRVMPNPWGHEHTHWTKRIIKAGLAPFFTDIVNSNSFITLNRHAEASVFTSVDKRRFARGNKTAAADLSTLNCPVVE